MLFLLSKSLADHLSTVLSQGQAKRLEGVTPASLACLMKYVRNGAARRAAADLEASTSAAAAIEAGSQAPLGL